MGDYSEYVLTCLKMHYSAHKANVILLSWLSEIHLLARSHLHICRGIQRVQQNKWIYFSNREVQLRSAACGKEMKKCSFALILCRSTFRQCKIFFSNVGGIKSSAQWLWAHKPAPENRKFFKDAFLKSYCIRNPHDYCFFCLFPSH